MKRVGFLADSHCGGLTGLTTPEYHGNDKLSKIRRNLYTEFKRIVRRMQPVDILITAGDLVDGDNAKEGGIGLITTDRIIQTDIASQIIREVNAQSVVVVKGTQYHVGQKEDWEDIIAREVGAVACSSREWVKVNGVTFDVKHKVAGSSLPYGSFTQTAKSNVWNLIWSEVGMQPRANIFVRAHTHTFGYCGDAQYLAVTLPCLQGYTRFGARNVERLIDWGMAWIDVESDGSYKLDWDIVRIGCQAAKVINL